MIALIAALLLGTQPLSVHPHRIERGAVTRYGAECAGKQTPACQVLRREAEAVLLYDFLILEQGGVKLDPAMLRNVAANAVTPGLRIAALERLVRKGLGKEDEPVVLAAMKSRFPAERRVALGALGRLSDERYSRMLLRTYRGKTSVFAAALDYREDELPPGLTAYPGAETVWFASGPNRTWFASADPPAKVIAAYTKDGRKAVTKTELEQAAKAASNIDPAEMMRLAQTDPQKMRQMMEKISAAGGTRVDASMDVWTAIERDEGVSEVRYVVLEDQPYLMGKIPTKVVAIFKDEILGKTAIVFSTREPPPDLPDPASPDYLAKMKLWQIVTRPLEPIKDEE